jgi:hypothetical protein
MKGPIQGPRQPELSRYTATREIKNRVKEGSTVIPRARAMVMSNRNNHGINKTIITTPGTITKVMGTLTTRVGLATMVLRKTLTPRPGMRARAEENSQWMMGTKEVPRGRNTKITKNSRILIIAKPNIREVKIRISKKIIKKDQVITTRIRISSRWISLVTHSSI